MISKRKERPNTKQVVTVFFFFSSFIPDYRDLFSYNINPKFRAAFIYLSQLTRFKWKQQKIAQSPAIKGLAVIFLKKKSMKINQLWLCIYCKKRILSNMKNTTASVSKRDLSLKLSLFLGIKKEKTK